MKKHIRQKCFTLHSPNTFGGGRFHMVRKWFMEPLSLGFGGNVPNAGKFPMMCTIFRSRYIVNSLSRAVCMGLLL